MLNAQKDLKALGPGAVLCFVTYPPWTRSTVLGFTLLSRTVLNFVYTQLTRECCVGKRVKFYSLRPVDPGVLCAGETEVCIQNQYKHWYAVLGEILD